MEMDRDAWGTMGPGGRTFAATVTTAWEGGAAHDRRLRATWTAASGRNRGRGRVWFFTCRTGVCGQVMRRRKGDAGEPGAAEKG